jgi:hypothetical protein
LRIASLPPIVHLTTDRVVIRTGEHALLTWSTERATNITATNFTIPAFQLQGSTFVSPTRTTTYTITAYGNGTASTSITVYVEK